MLSHQKTSMVIRPSRWGLAAALFALLSVALTEPPGSKVFRTWVPRTWSSPIPPAGPKVPLPPVPRASSPALPSTKDSVPADPRPAFTWDSLSRADPDILGRLREDAGIKDRSDDFTGPGPLDAAWTLLNLEVPKGPSWLRAKLESAPTRGGDGLALKVFFTADQARFVVSLVGPPGNTLGISELNVRLFEYPVKVGDNVILLSPQVGVWSGWGQPKAVWGGFWRFDVEVPLDDRLGVWLDGSGKTPGWTGSLDSGWQLQAGLHWFL